MLKSIIFGLGIASVLGADHPTLPTRWIGTTEEPEVGIGLEAYKFVDKYTDDNPSAIWSNYTDKNCFRIIYVSPKIKGRFLLKCDAVDCCTEDQDANQVEFQIPNVHPAAIAPVSHNVTDVTTTFETVSKADQWSWKFGPEHFNIYTTPDDTQPTGVKLHRWQVILGEPYNIDFDTDWKGIADDQAEDFDKLFQVPDYCFGPQVLRCDEARKQGLLKTKLPEPRLLRRPSSADKLKSKLASKGQQ